MDSEIQSNDQDYSAFKGQYCSDLMCIGVIGENGLCKECQRPFDPNLLKTENDDELIGENYIMVEPKTWYGTKKW